MSRPKLIGGSIGLAILSLLVGITIYSPDDSPPESVNPERVITQGGVALRNRSGEEVTDVVVLLKDSQGLNLEELNISYSRLKDGHSWHLELNELKERIPQSGRVEWQDSTGPHQCRIDFSHLFLPNVSELEGYFVITIWNGDRVDTRYWKNNRWLID